MKKTTRLTALLLALVLLLGTLSASATETNEIIIPLDSLTAEVYAALLADAEIVGLAAGRPCGASNPYCASVTKLVGLTTAQSRYDYLAGLSGVEAIGVLMHYNDYKKAHTAEDILCLCGYPNFYADHVPGHIDAEHTDCPWHFANLPVVEQYIVLRNMNSAEQEVYINTITDTEKETALRAYLASVYEPCDPDNCSYVEKYGIDFFSMNTFALYEALYSIYDTGKDSSGAESWEFTALIAHLRDSHISEGIFCQCSSFSIADPSKSFGTPFHSYSVVGGETIDCPWRFNALTTAEQAQIINGLTETEHSEYTETLSAQQKAELDAYLNGVGKTEETLTAKDPDNEEETLVTASITVPTGVFGTGVNHVMEAGEALMTTEKASALNQIAVGHTLAAFDISFYNLDRPGEKLQPVNGQTVPLTFTVDVSAVDGDTMQVYHLIENADGSITAEAVGEPVAVDKSKDTQEITINASSFSTYALRVSCNGDGEDCGYNAFIAMNGFEREAELIRLIGTAVTDDSESSTAYDEFISHINEYHYETAPSYCTCSFYKTRYDELGYGDITHEIDSFTQELCTWHFAQISVEDQYEVVKDMTETDREQYMTDAELSDEQKQALKDYIAGLQDPLAVVCVVEGNVLMCDGAALANITENGYIIDIATGIAVGRYDFTTQTFTMGTGTN